MKGFALLKLSLRLIGLPAAGALGVWLLAEMPAVHQAMCNPVGF